MTQPLHFDACKKSLQEALASAKTLHEAARAAGGSLYNTWRCVTYAQNALAYCEAAEKDHKRKTR